MSDARTDEQRIGAELGHGAYGADSFRPKPYRPDGVKIAPTTTGDATTGGMDMVDRASTSDASTKSVD